MSLNDITLSLFSKIIKFCTEVNMMLVCISDNKGSFIKRDTSLFMSDPEQKILIKISITMKF